MAAPIGLNAQTQFFAFFVMITAESAKALLGLWLRLECSLDSLSIDPAHVIYVAEGHNVGSERQSSVMTLRKPIVTWYVKTFQKRQLRVLNPARINVFYWFNWLNLIGS